MSSALASAGFFPASLTCFTMYRANLRKSGSTPSPGASDSVTRPASIVIGNTSSRSGFGFASTSA
jgi:hypothetical protein